MPVFIPDGRTSIAPSAARYSKSNFIRRYQGAPVHGRHDVAAWTGVKLGTGFYAYQPPNCCKHLRPLPERVNDSCTRNLPNAHSFKLISAPETVIMAAPHSKWEVLPHGRLTAIE